METGAKANTLATCIRVVRGEGVSALYNGVMTPMRFELIELTSPSSLQV